MESWTPESFVSKTDALVWQIKNIISHTNLIKANRDSVVKESSEELKHAYDVILNNNAVKIDKLISNFISDNSVRRLIIKEVFD
jgi:hypothetical protein